MDISNIAGFSGITAICYLVCLGIKATGFDRKWLPVIAGSAGAVLGIVGYYLIQEFPASDIIAAIAVGIVSGLAATGADQVYKQLSTGGVSDGEQG